MDLSSPAVLRAARETNLLLASHVLTEKPIDVSTAQANDVIYACDGAGVKLGVCFQDRVAPEIARLKQEVDDGRLGKPILVNGYVKWYRPPEYYTNSRWRGTRALDGGGALMNQGVHTVDLPLWLMETSSGMPWP